MPPPPAAAAAAAAATRRACSRTKYALPGDAKKAMASATPTGAKKCTRAHTHHDARSDSSMKGATAKAKASCVHSSDSASYSGLARVGAPLLAGSRKSGRTCRRKSDKRTWRRKKKGSDS